MPNSYFQDIVVQQRNYFELLKISPEMSPRDIVVFINESQNIDACLRTEFIRALNKPLSRFMNEIFTFHNPKYETEISPENKKKYGIFLKYISNGLLDIDDIDCGMTSYLYQKIENTPEFPAISGQQTGNQDRLFNLTNRIKDDPWVYHTLAIIFMKCAIRFAQDGNFEKAEAGWEKSMYNWSRVVQTKNFAALTETAKYHPDAKRIEIFAAEFNKIIGSIQDYFRAKFNLCLKQENLSHSTHILRCAFGIEESGQANGLTITRLSAAMLSDLFVYIDEKSKEDQMPDKLSANYQYIFDLLQQLEKDIPALYRERMFLYEIDKYIAMFRELDYNNYEAVAAEVKNLGKLFDDASNWCEKSAEHFVISEKVEELMMEAQNAGIDCGNEGISSGNQRSIKKALEILDALPGDRSVKTTDGSQITLQALREQLSRLVDFDRIIPLPPENKIDRLLDRFEQAISHLDFEEANRLKNEILGYQVSDRSALRKVLAGILNKYSVEHLDEITENYNRQHRDDSFVYGCVKSYIDREDEDAAEARKKNRRSFVIYWCIAGVLLYFTFGYSRLLFVIGLIATVVIGALWKFGVSSMETMKNSNLSYHGRNYCAKKGCYQNADYTFAGEYLCQRHAKALEEELVMFEKTERFNRLNQFQQKKARMSIKYLKMAVDIEPNNKVIKTNLDAASKLLPGI